MTQLRYIIVHKHRRLLCGVSVQRTLCQVFSATMDFCLSDTWKTNWFDHFLWFYFSQRKREENIFQRKHGGEYKEREGERNRAANNQRVAGFHACGWLEGPSLLRHGIRACLPLWPDCLAQICIRVKRKSRRAQAEKSLIFQPLSLWWTMWKRTGRFGNWSEMTLVLSTCACLCACLHVWSLKGGNFRSTVAAVQTITCTHASMG